MYEGQEASPQVRARGYVSEGGLEPPCPLRALAPQASASAYSATRTQPGRGSSSHSGRITIANQVTAKRHRKTMPRLSHTRPRTAQCPVRWHYGRMTTI